MGRVIYTKLIFSIFSFALLFSFLAIKDAHSSSGGVSFHGRIVEDSAAARNKCRSDAIELGISQNCSEHRGTIVRTTVIDSALNASVYPHSDDVTIRRIVMNYD
ncbi:hypothetical protein GWD52_20300 [Enterobacteriaceae bacterium 4M9]|nr:hypothetical protein [Enterobacteriaceae bacterium 4M9]